MLIIHITGRQQREGARELHQQAHPHSQYSGPASARFSSPRKLFCYSERGPTFRLLSLRVSSYYLNCKVQEMRAKYILFFLWTVLLVLIRILWDALICSSFHFAGARLIQGFPRGPDVWRRNIAPYLKPGTCLARPVCLRPGPSRSCGLWILRT